MINRQGYWAQVLLQELEPFLLGRRQGQPQGLHYQADRSQRDHLDSQRIHPLADLAGEPHSFAAVNLDSTLAGFVVADQFETHSENK